jgi:hypothetical protein
VDIYTAVKEGLPLDIEELKAAVDDPEGWAQEFECQFLDVQAILLPYELIASCESFQATATVPAGYWDAKLQFSIDMGIDFGRRHELAVCWSNAQLGDVAQTVEVLELAKMSTPEQIAILRPRLKRARTVARPWRWPCGLVTNSPLAAKSIFSPTSTPPAGTPQSSHEKEKFDHGYGAKASRSPPKLAFWTPRQPSKP